MEAIVAWAKGLTPMTPTGTDLKMTTDFTDEHGSGKGPRGVGELELVCLSALLGVDRR
jgi:hypothetical protein